MHLEHKDVAITGFKVLDDDNGIVSTIVSVTGIRDNVKDKILPGAYTKTLEKRTPKGIWSHDWKTPVSRTVAVKELMPGDPELPATLTDGKPWPREAGGLKVDTQFNMETQRGREAYSDVKFFGDQQEWSIGYAVPPGNARINTKNGERDIESLELYEYSPVLWGAMPLARSMSSKQEDGWVSVKEAQQAYRDWQDELKTEFKDCDPQRQATRDSREGIALDDTKALKMFSDLLTEFLGEETKDADATDDTEDSTGGEDDSLYAIDDADDDTSEDSDDEEKSSRVSLAIVVADLFPVTSPSFKNLMTVAIAFDNAPGEKTVTPVLDIVEAEAANHPAQVKELAVTIAGILTKAENSSSDDSEDADVDTADDENDGGKREERSDDETLVEDKPEDGNKQASWLTDEWYTKAGISNTAWDGSASRYSDEQYRAACLIDRGGNGSVKEACSLPYKEPDGQINRNGVHAAAAALAGSRGGVKDVTDEQKSAAAKKLLSIYKNTLHEDAPDSLVSMAGDSNSKSYDPFLELKNVNADLDAYVDLIFKTTED